MNGLGINKTERGQKYKMFEKKYIFLILAILGCFFIAARPGLDTVSNEESLFTEMARHELTELRAPASRSLDEKSPQSIKDKIYSLRGFKTLEGKVKSGQSLDNIFRGAGVRASESLSFSRALKPVFDPRNAQPGDAFMLLLDPSDQIFEFTYERSPVEIYSASKKGDGWDVVKLETKIDRRRNHLIGKVSGSLYESIIKAGGDADLIMAFADLFAWDIDFSRETREGDEFRLIYEKLFVRGELIGNGRVLAASYKGAAGSFEAIYFKSESSDGYYNPDGQSVRKSFLRSPLNFTRISSKFSRARKHPVLNVVRPHSGVDYAAPTGTSVWSVADGTVKYAGWKGQAGKTVIISHANGYESYYNHLSRFPKGIRRGAKVKQGQVIGYVGSTGLATGPHLDFRIKKNGKWVDPLKEKYRPGPPVAKADKEEFRTLAEQWTARLNELNSEVQLARKTVN